MKIIRTPSGSNSKIQKTSKKSVIKGESFASKLDGLGNAVKNTVPAEDLGAVSGIGSVLAAQELSKDQDNGSNNRVIRFATDILDRLDEVQRDILLGNLSKDLLIKLAQQLRSRKKNISDPVLLQIIKDIELRAEVELAKYT
ncbi:MAG: flagellar assembly protein FliX [Rhodospirillales bacterium]